MDTSYPPVRDALDKVVFDTAMGMTTGEMAAAYAGFGLAHRMIFGSDFPMHSPAQIIGDLRRTLSKDDLSKALSGNFLREVAGNGF